MPRNPSGKINRNLVAERMAVQRCTSQEAAQALQAYFDKSFETAKKASIRRYATIEQNEREENL